ncbi:replication initiation protein [Fibrivirga algicola]|uniref:Replication initiation protein n=1 Tax=Fibrivirga algicola TaxID=2950420 RepID=A0ABX0QM13_9BACT|nr:replication initiation protein [Fibrivirga algicola]NID13494.1 replication initiation protein [Fibrivirga algicola]
MGELVHIQEPLRLLLSRNNFDLLERRVYWLILRHIKQLQILRPAEMETLPSEFPAFKIPITDLQLPNSSSEVNYSTYKRVAQRLTSRQLYLDSPAQHEFTSVVVFPMARYSRGVLTVEVNKHLVPYMIDLSKGYTKLQLQAALSLNSQYAQNLYTRLCKFLDTGIWRVSVTDLKDILDAQQYVRWSNFKQTVLSRAMEEINQKTDIEVFVNEKREGRFITTLIFTIRRQSRKDNKAFDAFNEEMDLVYAQPIEELKNKASQVLLQHYRFTSAQIREIISNENLLQEFIRLDVLIQKGYIDVKTNPTRYIAGILFKKPKAAATK